MKKCIVCEKDIHLTDVFKDPPPDNIKGGTMDIDFGFGSKFDTGNGFSGRSFHFSAAICDECFEKKKHLGNWISLERRWERTIISEDIAYGT